MIVKRLNSTDLEFVRLSLYQVESSLGLSGRKALEFFAVFQAALAERCGFLLVSTHHRVTNLRKYTEKTSVLLKNGSSFTYRIYKTYQNYVLVCSPT